MSKLKYPSQISKNVLKSINNLLETDLHHLLIGLNKLLIYRTDIAFARPHKHLELLAEVQVLARGHRLHKVIEHPLALLDDVGGVLGHGLLGQDWDVAARPALLHQHAQSVELAVAPVDFKTAFGVLSDYHIRCVFRQCRPFLDAACDVDCYLHRSQSIPCHRLSYRLRKSSGLWRIVRV